MSIVIIGGHERMERQYKQICSEHNCKAKVFTKCARNLENLIGNPDLMVLFTKPVSHEMIKVAKRTAAARDIAMVQLHNGSGNMLAAALKSATA